MYFCPCNLLVSGAIVIVECVAALGIFLVLLAELSDLAHGHSVGDFWKFLL